VVGCVVGQELKRGEVAAGIGVMQKVVYRDKCQEEKGQIESVKEIWKYWVLWRATGSCRGRSWGYGLKPGER
jgi:hypothetical protein